MTENIDKEYIDDAFVNKINNCDNETLKNCLIFFLENYKTEYNYEDLEKINHELQSIFDDDLNIEHFIRQLKYLINKGVYGRINKRYKTALIELGFSPEKMELFCEVQKNYFDANLETNEKEAKNQIYTLKDFEMMTEMPVVDSKYRVMVDDEKNEDIKKQKLLINMRLTKGNENNREVIQVDKNQLIGLFSQIEKLQEQVDKLS